MLRDQEPLGEPLEQKLGGGRTSDTFREELGWGGGNTGRGWIGVGWRKVCSGRSSRKVRLGENWGRI